MTCCVGAVAEQPWLFLPAPPASLICRSRSGAAALSFPKHAMQIIRCDESWSEQILSILNNAIFNPTSLYDYRPQALDLMTGWFAASAKAITR